MSHFVLRPVTYHDAKALYALTKENNIGLTSLPLTMAHCLQKIETSLRTWENPGMYGGAYWFVLEEKPSGRCIGCAMITPKSGQEKPILSFQKETLERHCPALNIHTTFDILHFCRWQHQPTELGGLFLSPHYRQTGVGRLLSLGRLMAIGIYPQRFDTMLIAQMRGVIDKHGQSPFWKAVSHHFCPLSFKDLDRHIRKSKHFLLDLFPHIPIYVHMLPKEIQSILGKTHVETQGAAHLLIQEGFSVTAHIDIGDGGPILQASRDTIRLIREHHRVPVTALLESPPTDGLDCLLAIQTPTGPHITQTKVSPGTENGIGISRILAHDLGIEQGQAAWITPSKSQPFLRRFSEWFTTLAAGQTTSHERVQESPTTPTIPSP